MGKTMKTYYEIPDEFGLGMAMGMYKPTGLVVRNTTVGNGQIAKHFPLTQVTEVDLYTKRDIACAGAACLAGGAAICATGFGIYKLVEIIKEKREKKYQEFFDKAFKIYNEALQSDRLNLDIINNLISSIVNANQKGVTLLVDANDIVPVILYTKNLMVEKNMRIEEKEQSTLSDANVISLLSVLQAQKRVFETAA